MTVPKAIISQCCTWQKDQLLPGRTPRSTFVCDDHTKERDGAAPVLAGDAVQELRCLDMDGLPLL
jgi:hypothetical protein